MKNWLKNFGIGVLLGLVAVFLIVWLVYTILILRSDPQLANAYVAVGTLILAFVTALLVLFTYLSVKSGYDREERDRKERLLNEVIEWAEGIITDVLESNVFDIVTLSQGINRDDAFEGLFNEVKNLRKASAKSTKILTIAHKVDQASNENIEENVQALVNELGEQIGFLTEYRRDPKSGSMGDLTQNIPKLKNAATHNESLINLATVVVKEATEIKAEL